MYTKIPLAYSQPLQRIKINSQFIFIFLYDSLNFFYFKYIINWLLLHKVFYIYLTQKNPSFRFYRIFKNLHSTFSYELILMKTYMNANIVKTQILFDEVWPQRSLNVTYGHLFIKKSTILHKVKLDLKGHGSHFLILWYLTDLKKNSEC